MLKLSQVTTAKIIRLVVTTMTASGLVFTVAELANIQKAQASYYCQCVDYVKQKTGIPAGDAPGHAKDMGYYLQNHGWTRVSSPQINAIAILGTSFPYSDRTYGHVGLFSSIRNSGNNTYISLLAANQGGNGTDANCNDVSTWNIGTPVNGRGDIAFYVKGAASNSGNTNTNPFRSVNFTGVTSQYRTSTLSAPSGNTIGYINPNTRVSFDGWIYGNAVNDLWTGRPDRRWYRVAGTNYWVASAYINGNAPGSQP